MLLKKLLVSLRGGAMNNLESLYRSFIMEHSKYPRNKGLKGFKSFHLNNPSCGDDITVEALIEEGVIKQINHDGVGCSICCSSASVMSEVLKGKTKDEALELIEEFSQMLMGKEFSDKLEDASIYQGVSKFPARIKCASLPWKALEKVIKDE